MIHIKTPEEIKIMSEGGHMLALIRDELASLAKPGITTKQLDDIAFKRIKAAGGEPSFLGHGGFPATICASVNEQIVHGIPGNQILQEGDIIGIDIGMKYKGFHNDTAVTVPVGQIDKNIQNLLDITKKSFYAGLKEVKNGVHLGDVQNAIQKVIESAKYGIVRELTGHGVGRELQEEPSIPNFGKKGTGYILKTGMVIAIEPMVTLGSPEINISQDGWTITTSDLSMSAHFEHTLAVTPSGAQILTQ